MHVKWQSVNMQNNKELKVNKKKQPKRKLKNDMKSQFTEESKVANKHTKRY